MVYILSLLAIAWTFYFFGRVSYYESKQLRQQKPPKHLKPKSSIRTTNRIVITQDGVLVEGLRVEGSISVTHSEHESRVLIKRE